MSIGAKGITNTAGLVAFRFFLGIVEAGFFPGVMLLLSCWYKVSRGVSSGENRPGNPS
jgi:MFS family permease